MGTDQFPDRNRPLSKILKIDMICWHFHELTFAGDLLCL